MNYDDDPRPPRELAFEREHRRAMAAARRRVFWLFVVPMGAAVALVWWFY